MAGIMIEDQIAPKRCGHTKGKSVVGREEAYSRVRAACDARYRILKFTRAAAFSVLTPSNEPQDPYRFYCPHTLLLVGVVRFLLFLLLALLLLSVSLLFMLFRMRKPQP